MTREEVLDLLPLYAGGDLDDATREVVRVALATDPTLEAEAREWQALDGLLERTLAPAPARPALQVTVRRRCPYCHDALQAGSIALCASCATPHHAACFGQNHGCSLLGCGGTRAVEVGGPESVVCGGCERPTPAGAPFCAWCGEGVGDVASRPLHERAPRRDESPWSPRRYLAAAAVLVASTFGMGAFFGEQQRGLLSTLTAVSGRAAAERAQGHMPRVLEALAKLQGAFRVNDLDGDGVLDYAGSLAELTASLAKIEGRYTFSGGPWITRAPATQDTALALLGPRDVGLVRDTWTWDDTYEVSVHTLAGARFCMVARPREVTWLTTWFVSDEGRALELHDAVEVDLATCRLVPRRAR